MHINDVLQRLLALNLKVGFCCFFFLITCLFVPMLLLSLIRECLQSAGWSWGRLRKLNIYLTSATKTSRDRSRFPSDSHSHIMLLNVFYWTSSECVITSPGRYGVNHLMALVQSTFSREWEDSCKLCCSAIQALGLFTMRNTSICITACEL